MAELIAIGADPFLIDIDSLAGNVQTFLQADILIVNIPSKNIAGFRQLVDAIKGSNLKNVLFVSSTSVYKNINKTITESDTEFYSDSPLLTIEDMFTDWGNNKTTLVRFGGLIGYGRHPGRFFKPGRVVQNPDSPVNLIHRDDCIGIISQIIEQGVWGEVFNCCTDTHPTKREFYTRATRSLGYAPPKFGESEADAGKKISNQRVKQRLNYTFKHPDLMRIEFEESV
ncbi:MAG: SDR family NAD(P)-dependent oxidoreductase [Chloroflexota bacterium]